MKRRNRAPQPAVTVTLATTITVAFGVELAGDGQALCRALGFIPARPSFGAALGSMFLHDPDHIGHILGNLLALAVVGAMVEPVIGHWRLLATFLAAGLTGCMMHMLVDPIATTPLVGASGGLMGLAAVAAVVKPRVMLGGVVTYVALNVLGLFVESPLLPAGVSAAAHVGGFSLGVAAVALSRLRGVELRRRARAAHVPA